MYNGLIIFDIDGTLTTGIDNYEVVQYFLDKNYAVGISTSGAIYHPRNLLSFSWMPINLYIFMENHNFDTFNNVTAGILCGKYNPSAYVSNPNLDIYKNKGWLKGISLEITGRRYGLPPEKIFLFDNDPNYLNGCFLYNNRFNLVCAGKPCGKENLSIYNVLNPILKAYSYSHRPNYS